MTKYEIVLAFDVSCYATFVVDGETREKAIEQAMLEAQDTAFQTEWDTATEHRVIVIAELPSPKTNGSALEIVLAAARAHAQSRADDADKSDEEATEEREIWEAIEQLAAQRSLS